MPRDLNKGLLKYIKGPSYFKHFLIGTIGSDSARARLSGASRYIFTIATGYESTHVIGVHIWNMYRVLRGHDLQVTFLAVLNDKV